MDGVHDHMTDHMQDHMTDHMQDHMNDHMHDATQGGDEDQVNVVGFEVPTSPDSSYNNAYPVEDESGPPLVPRQLQQTLLNVPTGRDSSGILPPPQNVTLNHLYIENSERPRPVVALGVTHRFRSKFVTVVLYKPVQRNRG